MLAANGKTHRERRRKSNTKSAFSTTVKPLIASFLIVAAIGAMLLLCASALLLKASDPTRYQTPAALVVLYLSAFLGGVTVTRMTGRRAPLLYGAVLGLLMPVLTAVFSAVIPTEWCFEHTTVWTLLMRLAILPCCILGALFASRKKSARRKRK